MFKGVKAGYAKFETFPVWDLPLDHPVNVSYEAATLDLNDKNLIDYFHEEAYGIKSVNYNRDLNSFPLLKKIFSKITKTECIYKSPTDMGVNCISNGIIDEKIICDAAKQEIIRRHLRCVYEYYEGLTTKEVVKHSKSLMKKVNVTIEDRKVVTYARESRNKNRKNGYHGISCGAAIELKDGTIITGSNSPLLHSSAAMLMNAGKKLSGIPQEINLLAPSVLDSIAYTKENIYGTSSASLDVNELLIALSVSSIMNPTINCVLEKFKLLNSCEMHLTHIPTDGDISGLRKLGIHVTFDPYHSSNKLFDI